MKAAHDHVFPLEIPVAHPKPISLLERFKNSDFIIRLTNWEYWPFDLVYFPVMFYWLWLSWRARSFFFFSSANPGIEFGGMLGESKYRIMEHLPENLRPCTLYIRSDSDPQETLARIKDKGLTFPLIGKPDVGERGWLVQKIDSENDFLRYTDQMKVDFLIQEYVDLPMELGVFYYRIPGEDIGHISSITEKEFLTVQGDGKSSLKRLIQSNPRAKLQSKTLHHQYGSELDRILARGERKILVTIGNHRLGTAFLNGNYLINSQLVDIFHRIASGFEGFYFGRFDIRCRDAVNLYQGNFRIMELNGAGAEPTHIYHPGASIWEAYRVILAHLRILFQVSVLNNKAGHKYMTLKEGLQFLGRVRHYKKLQVRHQR